MELVQGFRAAAYRAGRAIPNAITAGSKHFTAGSTRMLQSLPYHPPHLQGFPYPNTKVYDDEEISILSMLGGREAAKTSLRIKAVTNARSH